MRVVDWGGRIGLAVVITLGLLAVRPMVDDLAGKDTKVNIVGQLGWGGTAAGAAWGGVERRRRKQVERTAAKRTGSATPLPSLAAAEVDP
jgi:hypothetical protein